MKRRTGTYSTNRFGDEDVRAFVPHRLPSARPTLTIADSLAGLHADAMAAVSRLEVAGAMVPSHEWFLYGFVRKEALISFRIEGTQATLEDVVVFEVTRKSERPADTEEVCNYVAALSYACEQLRLPNGLPVCVRLLCEVHRKLMKGGRGKEKHPGTIRTSQNWMAEVVPAMRSSSRHLQTEFRNCWRIWKSGFMESIGCRHWSEREWLMFSLRRSIRFSMATAE